MGQSGTELTLDHLRSAIDHIKHSCPGCGGSGLVFAETYEQYMGRVAVAYAVTGHVRYADMQIRQQECPACDGTGRSRYDAGLA